MKKILAILLMVFIMVGISACDETKTEESNNDVTDNTKVEVDNEDKNEADKENKKENDAFKEAESKLLKTLEPLPKVEKEYKIAAINPTLSNPFWVTFKEGYEAAAKEYNVTCDVLATAAEDDVNGQLDLFKTAVGKNYDSILFSSITEFNLIPGVLEANEKDIPVIAVGNNIDEEKSKEVGAKVMAHITTDTEKQGELGAKFITDKIKSGKVVIIEGISGASQSERRKQGAKTHFESTEGIEIVSIQSGEWDRKKAYDITTSLMQSNEDIKGVFCANDMMALGVVDALKSIDKKDDVTVVGVDFIPEAGDSIKAKELDATVAMSPYLYAKGGLLLSLKILEGQEIDDKLYWTPLELVNYENVDSFEGWM